MNAYFPPLEFWWTAWTFEPSIWFSIVLLHGSYLLLVGPFRSRFPTSQPITSRQLTFWTLGILAIIIALITPLALLADVYLFSAHMLQHILLTLVAPPLLLLGLPSWLFDPLKTRPTLLRLVRELCNPFIAFAIFNVTFVAWHIPALYNLALYSPVVHLLEHATLFLTAMVTWMPVLSPTKLIPRLPLPLQVFYVFLQSVVGTGLGAILTLAKEPIYIFYAQQSRMWGIPVLEDQVWAGLLMWSGGALIWLLVLTIVFFRWFGAKGPVEGEHKFV
ncbi:MAG: cytochrome c oxidase assembly protein [Chloroflexota bacterium]|nr:MAG: cytochrome c oxidase assembly protein [Chloroflexota bacterium]